MDTKNNTFNIINKFFSADIQDSPEKLLLLLQSLVHFESGCISISDKSICNIGTNNKKYILEENLEVKSAKFGKIIIARNNAFNKKDKALFKTCSLIIADIIKDYELSKTITMQLSTLQEGILEKDQAYQSEKIKNDFFANFSHELRTPLNSIISSSEILSEKIFGNLTSKQEEYISDIRVAGIHLLGMINDILDLSKLESNLMKLNKTQFDLSRLFEEIKNIVNPIANKKNIKIEINCNENIIINADYQKFQQILFNLTSNAIKYTPGNGKIIISAKKDDSKVIISVKDNGIGIPKNDQKRIFDKFVQLNSKKDSSGLGLTITKELVRLHKGKIKVKSSQDKGSEFLIEVPSVLNLI